MAFAGAACKHYLLRCSIVVVLMPLCGCAKQHSNEFDSEFA